MIPNATVKINLINKTVDIHGELHFLGEGTFMIKTKSGRQYYINEDYVILWYGPMEVKNGK